MENAEAGKFEVEDIVFAEYREYLPWPGRIIRKHEQSAVVLFISTNDCQKISYSKIWPYDDEQKKKYVTKESLDYDDFRLAILMTEQRMGGKDTDILNYVWQVMHPGAENTSPSVALAPSPAPATAPAPAPSTAPSTSGAAAAIAAPGTHQREIELAYMRKVHQESSSLRVERQFVGEINKLLKCLTIGYKNYDEALAAFEQLLQMPVSKLLLLRNFEAVDCIRLLCRFAASVEAHTVNRDAAIMVKSQANKLMAGFIACFELPYTKDNFWSEFVHLSEVYMRYTMEFMPRQAGAADNKGTPSGQ
ncbi:uncharacterized protein [Drosophila pseudoobscura]|uniref:Uncharacterized protein isoform X2 n=1 Tax=Drosophila pseudoobscura pseudoobscura TaxID=46245 RepID=A0A6I8V2W2_DROPS|nr:uncharacterized protein LOC6897353 isoform X2 [Drosophila pseudoobscura]